MTLIDDTCDGCGSRFDPMGDPLLTKHPEIGPYVVFCARCEAPNYRALLAPAPASETAREDDEDLRALLAATRDLDYDPSQEAWICGDHGLPECTQGSCADLPWPKPNASAMLSAFMGWAESEFRRTVRPYDESDDPGREMPEEAFRSYSVSEWPLGAFLATPAPPPPTTVQADRDALGRKVREVWVEWAREQADPKSSWLVPWEGLSEPDREVDRRIGEVLFAMGFRRGWVEAAPTPLSETARCVCNDAPVSRLVTCPALVHVDPWTPAPTPPTTVQADPWNCPATGPHAPHSWRVTPEVSQNCGGVPTSPDETATVQADPYCPEHGDRPTAYDSCSCADVEWRARRQADRDAASTNLTTTENAMPATTLRHTLDRTGRFGGTDVGNHRFMVDYGLGFIVQYWLSDKEWQVFGCPNQITITVEAGSADHAWPQQVGECLHSAPRECLGCGTMFVLPGTGDADV